MNDTLATRAKPPREEPVITLAFRKIGQTTCRHRYQLVVAKDRLFLRCDCGAELPGLRFDGPQPRRTA